MILEENWKLISFCKERLFKSSHPHLFLRKSVPKYAANLQENTHAEVWLRNGCSPVNMLHIFRTVFPRNMSGWLFQTVFILCLSKINVQIFFFKNHLRTPLFEKTSITNYHHPFKCCFSLVLSWSCLFYLIPARPRWFQLVSASFSRFQLVPAVLLLRFSMSTLMALVWNFRLVFFFVSRFSFYKNIWTHQSLINFESFDNLLFRSKIFFIWIIWKNIAEEKKILYFFLWNQNILFL